MVIRPSRSYGGADAEPVFPRGTHMADDPAFLSTGESLVAESTSFYVVGPEESAIFLSGSKSGAVDMPGCHDVCVLICILQDPKIELIVLRGVAMSGGLAVPLQDWVTEVIRYACQVRRDVRACLPREVVDVLDKYGKDEKLPPLATRNVKPGKGYSIQIGEKLYNFPSASRAPPEAYFALGYAAVMDGQRESDATEDISPELGSSFVDVTLRVSVRGAAGTITVWVPTNLHGSTRAYNGICNIGTVFTYSQRVADAYRQIDELAQGKLCGNEEVVEFVTLVMAPISQHQDDAIVGLNVEAAPKKYDMLDHPPSYLPVTLNRVLSSMPGDKRGSGRDSQ
ncbi:hypothetical protein IMY05_C4795000100 [Salix suchowensis]|nr:hypothetical protein IMY05_C4795000100 [Salix suchowensis]